MFEKPPMPAAEQHQQKEKEIVDLNTPELNRYLELKIKDAKSIGDIVHGLMSVKGIMGSSKFYTSHEAIRAIQDRIWGGREKYGKLVRADITRTFGLRDKAEELVGDKKPLLLVDYEKNFLEIEKEIRNAGNMTDLIKVVKSYAGLSFWEGDDIKSYSAQEINKGIQYAHEHPEEGENRFRYLTRGYGLRGRVAEFIRMAEEKKKKQI